MHNFYLVDQVDVVIRKGGDLAEIAKGLKDHAAKMVKHAKRLGGGSNLAVAAIKMPSGNIVYKAMPNISQLYHSEKLLVEKLQKYVGEGGQIIGIYSQKKFCNGWGQYAQNCTGMLKDFAKIIGQEFPAFWSRQ